MACVAPVPALPQAETVALREALHAVARELDLIVELGERAQSAISPYLRGAGGAALEAQDLDALVQQACGLAAFVTALGRGCPEGWTADPTGPAAALRLHAQRRRLSTPLAPPPEPAASGVFELF